jgi:hypothetical protein
MSLPNFIIIGAQKSGTTWLYEILKTHPKIKMAHDRKEVHFFDRYFDRGIKWYKERFPYDENFLIGEATPKYIYDKEVPKRIYNNIPEVKLILSLRNPIERAYSQYKYLVQEDNYQQDFKQAIKEYPDILKRGLYFEQIERYLNFFERNQLTIIIFEEMITKEEEKLNEIADFLNLDFDFDKDSIYGKANVSKVPKYKLLYSFGKYIVKKLYDYDDLIFMINFLKKIGFKRLFFDKNKNNFPDMSLDSRKYLSNYYKEDILKLEELLDRELTKMWKLDY